jgi:hypothetical protein
MKWYIYGGRIYGKQMKYMYKVSIRKIKNEIYHKENIINRFSNCPLQKEKII